MRACVTLVCLCCFFVGCGAEKGDGRSEPYHDGAHAGQRLRLRDARDVRQPAGKAAARALGDDSRDLGGVAVDEVDLGRAHPGAQGVDGAAGRAAAADDQGGAILKDLFFRIGSRQRSGNATRSRCNLLASVLGCGAGWRGPGADRGRGWERTSAGCVTFW